MKTMTERTNPFTRTNPFMTSIKERYSLCKPGSKKETTHIVLDLTDPSFCYVVGDSIGIYSPNDEVIVEKTLKSMRLTGNETVINRRLEQSSSFRDYLIHKASITEFSKKFLGDIRDRQTDPVKKAMLEELFEDKKEIKKYIAQREVWDLLEENQEVTFSAQEYTDVLMPNLPRLYSISSSQMAHPEEVHLTVALTEYETNGHKRYGVCTHYLCNLAPIGKKEIPVYLHPHNGFTLPENPDTTLIMVGPGTGVAPFRSFMEERVATQATGKNWLFFGEWTKKHEFFYEDEWKNLVMEGVLRLDTAFSRDQEHKVYVQDRMLENAKELFQLLQEGAYFYVCGDMARMAKDVDAALHKIVEEQGNMTPEKANAYVKNLRLQKRYLRDVY